MILSILSFLLQAPQVALSHSLPKILQEIEKRYQNTGTVSANFHQTHKNELLHQKEISTGQIFIQKPSKIRWETQSPEKQLLISDGKLFWFYTPPWDATDQGQMIEKKASAVHTHLTTELLSGNFSHLIFKKKFNLKSLSKTVFLLTPTDSKAVGGVSKIKLQVDNKKKEIIKITLEYSKDHYTEIEFQNVQLGIPLDTSFFKFQPPQNTVILKENKS